MSTTKALLRACKDAGFRAFVGRCQMDRNAPDTYREADAKTSCAHTRELIEYSKSLSPDGLVQPILTPRFAICCTPELLSGIADIAKEQPDLRIQTHLSENADEISTTMELFPHAKSYTDVNLWLRSGLFPLERMLERGVKLGLGTDVSAGHSVSMQQAICDAITVSKVISMQTMQEPRVSLSALFYLATLGGAHVCGLEDRIGSFQVGKEFDALCVQTGLLGAAESLERRFWRWLVCGDDREIKRVFVRGVHIG
ncbi:guanine deaminase [Malassezia cuniculi]|uniref:Guanine deaminase n=1 Tax=Malassezia cuniculi TaxID=948313 RepID=A0AAF0EW15_9BASI|nr:guanine deaminase [Malassezia cuniculi]